MSKPILTEVVGGYDLLWESDKLTIEVRRLHLHNIDGRVTCELLFKSGDKIIYPQTQINLTSERTRTGFTKTLNEADSHYSWDNIIKQLALLVIEKSREGEPVHELWTNEDVSPPEFLLSPILYKGLPTIVYGEKAVCKSTLALIVYASLALPWRDNPLGWQVPPRPLKVLLADYETEKMIAQYNITQIQKGMDLPHFPLYYRRCSLPLADDVEQIQRHMTKIGAEVLIVDSLGPAVGGDLKDPSQALRFTSALRQLKCAALIIGQTSKNKDTKVRSVFGSTFFEYYARNIVEIRKVQEEEDTSLDIALYNTYHNLGRRFAPMGYHLNFNGQGTRIERSEITAKELVAHIGTGQQVKSLLLSRGALTTKEIAGSLDLTENNVRVALSRLRKKDLLIKTGDSYGIVARKEEVYN